MSEIELPRCECGRVAWTPGMDTGQEEVCLYTAMHEGDNEHHGILLARVMNRFQYDNLDAEEDAFLRAAQTRLTEQLFKADPNLARPVAPPSKPRRWERFRFHVSEWVAALSRWISPYEDFSEDPDD